ncbi:PhnE/PtxC family ABC transporter permease [Aneurinibacillus terranovensis]|uniref:PhnE/PtxC family ABC transporter permease n=1 Tax=Aneurinibacillus terranovensis TaxID=278991 RepID=UPI00041659B4|nr:ABC transporter permease subunit [Aneurinibacillus terranovensis]
MDDLYVTKMQADKGEFLRQKLNKSGKIRINNPEYNRPVKVFLGIVIVLSILSLVSLDINWVTLASRLGNLVGVFADLAKFNFSNIGTVFIAFAESVAVTILATLYSLIMGLVMGAFMAKNITPSNKLAVALSALHSFVRAVPTPVWVLLFLACLGFGPAPGIVGLSLHATAFFARAFTQAFEEVSTDTIEALRATGATRIQIFFSAILPASLTALIAWGAMRFEINFSESSILGMVGGGGIGYSIAASMTGYNLGRAGVSILMVFLFAYSLELIFTAMKRRMKI